MNGDFESLTALEHRLGRLFVIGLSISAAVLVVGLVLYLANPHAAAPLFVLNAGLAILMVTPLMRVVVSIVEYFRLRDWVFVATTVAVLAELSFTMMYAFMYG